MDADDLKETIRPIVSRSLKDSFIEHFEALVLSGTFKPGERVPSERALCELFRVSRPVVHEGLRALEGRGLVTIESRKGVRVNDFRRQGSVELLLSLFNYSSGKVSPELFDGILEMRLFFETETAGLAASRRSDEHMAEILNLVNREAALSRKDPGELAQIDYDFHLAVAIASENPVYPLLMNSFRRFYLNVLTMFYSNPDLILAVFGFHAILASAIERRDSASARATMREILEFGQSKLRRVLVVSGT